MGFFFSVSILSSLEEKAAELCGCPMLFELVEVAKENLTEQNLPSDICSVCFLHFQVCEGGGEGVCVCV